MESEKSILSGGIGVKIKIFRMMRNYKFDDLAGNIGIDPRHLRRAELGQVSLSSFTLFKISQVLEMPIGDFFEPCLTIAASEFFPNYGKFELRQTDTKKYYWVLTDQNQHLILISKFFAAKEKCQQSIKESRHYFDSYHLVPKKSRGEEYYYVQKNQDTCMAYGLFLGSLEANKSIISNLLVNLKLP